MQEIWKDIPNYVGMYKVSNLGNVKSIGRYVDWRNTKKFFRTRILRAGSDKSGYSIVVLCKSGMMKAFKIHRLVAILFIQNINNKLEVNHINGIKTDNNINNLEWCTHSENLKHAHRIGLKKATWGGVFGKDNPLSRPVYQYDINGMFIKKYDSTMCVQRELNISNGNISSVCLGRKGFNSAGGYVWKYFKRLKK